MPDNEALDYIILALLEHVAKLGSNDRVGAIERLLARASLIANEHGGGEAVVDKIRQLSPIVQSDHPRYESDYAAGFHVGYTLVKGVRTHVPPAPKHVSPETSDNLYNEGIWMGIREGGWTLAPTLPVSGQSDQKTS